MDAIPLQIQMLGGFSIRQGGMELNISGRSRKLCLLLACLICQRDRPVPYEELAGVLWEGEGPGASSLNALKAILYRARACLDQWVDGAGRTLILNREGCYQWNTALPLTLDTERFLALCQTGRKCASEEERLSRQMEAFPLYRGDFFLTGSAWADTQREALHQAYLQTALEPV